MQNVGQMLLLRVVTTQPQRNRLLKLVIATCTIAAAPGAALSTCYTYSSFSKHPAGVRPSSAARKGNKQVSGSHWAVEELQPTFLAAVTSEVEAPKRRSTARNPWKKVGPCSTSPVTPKRAIRARS
eukprot:scaffold7519_cov417-Prasinococcus_capsulatus_cf.AAC.3